MNRHNRTYGDLPSVNTGDPCQPLLGIAKARAKFINHCWCGEIKHTDRPVCNLCIRMVEDDSNG